MSNDEPSSARDPVRRTTLLPAAEGCAIWEWDLPTGVVRVSAAVVDLLGAEVGRPGEPWSDLRTRIAPPDRERVAEGVRAALEDGERWTARFRVLRPGGSLAEVIEHAYLVRSGGTVVRALGVLSLAAPDLAAEEQARLLDRERQARQQAEAENRAKDEFLAVVSHELRRPLNAVLGWAQLLLQFDFDPAKQRDALEKIERNARLQTKLVEDLLDVSRILNGKLEIDADPVPLAGVVGAAIDGARPTADAALVAIAFTDESGGARIRGSAHRIAQIAGNLLSNAIKFGKAGGLVDVTVRRAGSFLELIVRDEGEGIAPEFMPHLFERFHQADASTTRRFGGLGLGLFVVRQLTRLHGGDVSAASDGPGRGATFTVRLPVESEATTEPFVPV